jgi:hypothetical protein
LKHKTWNYYCNPSKNHYFPVDKENFILVEILRIHYVLSQREVGETTLLLLPGGPVAHKCLDSLERRTYQTIVLSKYTRSRNHAKEVYNTHFLAHIVQVAYIVAMINNLSTRMRLPFI